MIQTIRRELDVPVDKRSMAPLREFVREVLAEAQVGKADARQIVIGIDEVCSAIILHAEPLKATGSLQVLIDVDPTRVKVRVADTANDYDAGDVTRDELLQDYTRGKQTEIGLFLVRRIMDEFTYTYRKGFQSEIEMIKFLYAAD
jgi:anti-sigma regulatory factor (Ser/Thr protein kinase)